MPDRPLKRCPECGGEFACGAEDPCGHCWCFDLPHIMPLTEGMAGCFCPACLTRRIAACDPASGPLEVPADIAAARSSATPGLPELPTG